MLASLLRKTKYRGVAMVEYAILLALVVTVSSFVSFTELSMSIEKIMNNVATVMGAPSKDTGPSKIELAKKEISMLFADALPTKHSGTLGNIIACNNRLGLNEYLSNSGMAGNANVTGTDAGGILVMKDDQYADKSVADWYFSIGGTAGSSNKVVTVSLDGSDIYDASSKMYLAGEHTAIQYAYISTTVDGVNCVKKIGERVITYNLERDSKIISGYK